MDLGPINRISVLSAFSFKKFCAIHTLRSYRQEVMERGRKNRIGLNSKTDLCIIRITVEIKTMTLNDLTKRKHID